MTRTPALPERLARAATLLVAAGFVLVIALHVIARGNVDPLLRPVSDYYDDPAHRAWMEVAYVSIGAGGFALGLALRYRARGSGATLAGATLLAGAAAAVVFMAIWPDGVAHRGLVQAGQGSLLLGVGLLAVGVRDRPAWKSFRAFSWLVVGMAALGLAGVQKVLPAPGLLQRVYYALVLAWFLVAARYAGTDA